MPTTLVSLTLANHFSDYCICYGLKLYFETKCYFEPKLSSDSFVALFIVL